MRKTAAIGPGPHRAGVGGLPRPRRRWRRSPDSSDPGLLFDWARALRLAEHRTTRPMPCCCASSPPRLARDHAARWWAEVNVAGARCADGRRSHAGALALVEHAGLPVGDQYAEQQFLAGFIALRFLKDPAAALTDFQRLDAGVSRPISKSRAEYWQGRAYEALGDTASAYAHYRLAAAYPETFYGQLALARTEAAPVLHLSDTDRRSRRQAAEIEKRSPDARRSRCWPIWARPAICACSWSAMPKSIPRPGHLKRLHADADRLGLSGDRGPAGQDRRAMPARRCRPSPIR